MSMYADDDCMSVSSCALKPVKPARDIIGQIFKMRHVPSVASELAYRLSKMDVMLENMEQDLREVEDDLKKLKHRTDVVAFKHEALKEDVGDLKLVVFALEMSLPKN